METNISEKSVAKTASTILADIFDFLSTPTLKAPINLQKTTNIIEYIPSAIPKLPKPNKLPV